MTMTVTVTDSRGRTATYTTTFNVLDYSPPSITAFSAERCNSDGSAAQLDGTKARYSFAGKVTALNNKNGLSCVVYYKLKSATAWTTDGRADGHHQLYPECHQQAPVPDL